ncbi:MAG: DUF4738 domain-containing protein [Alloprevotella sp.]
MKNLFKTSLIAAALMLAACGGKQEAKTETQDNAAVEAPARPHADNDLNREYVATLGGHRFEINIKRTADTELPTVSDELGGTFYDNRVEITATRDGEDLFTKQFTKSDFADFVSAADSKGCVLLGMAFDQENSSATTLRFGAQIGQPGIEEGPAFIVEIPTGGGACSIVRDMRQDTMGEEGEQ